jgi:WD40 repeat protein
MPSRPSILPMLVDEGQPAFIERIYGEPLFFTESEILALQFAPDDSLWSIEESGIARQWSGSGKLINRFFLSELETLWAINKDATLAVSGSDEMKLWDLTSGRLIVGFEPGPWITAFAFSPSGKILVSGHDDGKIRFWDLATRKMTREIEAHASAISSITFLSGDDLATAAEDHMIRLWSVSTFAVKQSLVGHVDRIPSLTYSERQKLLVSAGWDTTARVWEPGNQEPLILLNSHSEQVLVVAFGPDGSTLACADSDHAIHVWNDVRSGKTSFVLSGHSDEIRALTFNSSGKRLASGGVDRVVHIWDVQQGRLIAGSDPSLRNQIVLSESAERSWLFSAAASTVQGWDTKTGESIWTTDSNVSARSLATSPSGALLALSDSSPEVRVLDLKTKSFVRTLTHTKGPILDLVYSPDSSLLATASITDGLVWVWKEGEAEAILVIPEAADGCTLETIAFHPQKNLIAVGGLDIMGTGGSDGAICFWDLSERDRIDTIPTGVTSLAFDASGKYLAGGSIQNEICVWDAETREEIAVLKGHHERIGAVLFDKSGSKLLSASDDGSIRVWNWADNQLLLARQFETPIHSLTLSQDGTKLFCGNSNNTCSQFDFAKFLND